jgi:hypothetical protein
MMKNFTENDLTKFLYGESDQDIAQQINIALLQNEKFDEDVDAYAAIIQRLDQFRIKAPKSVTDKILEYSSNYSLESV